MKAQSALGLAVLATVSCAIGVGLDRALLSESGASSAAAPGVGDSSEAIATLRAKLQEAESQVALLKDELKTAQAAAQGLGKSGKPSGEPPSPGVRGDDQALKARIKELEAALARAEGKLSPEELAAKIGDQKSAFAKAVAAKDARAAIAAMKALSALGEDGFPDLVSMWAEMEQKEWLGLNRMERQGWFENSNFFHWFLAEERAGVSPEVSPRLVSGAVMALAFMESDVPKRNQTFVNLLQRLGPPAALDPAEQSQRGRGFGPMGMQNNDPFRLALNMLTFSFRGAAPTQAPETTGILSKVSANNEMPSDVRVSALYGLAQSKSAEAQRALSEATYDSNPEVKEAAEMAQKQQQATVTGLFVTSVAPDSEGAKAGIPLGCIITQVNGQNVRNFFELMGNVRGASTETVPVTFVVNGSSRTVPMKANGNFGIQGNPVVAGE